jgi:hypothetical protein
MEREKHMYMSDSELATQDGLSKMMLVFSSVIQFIDLCTDTKLLYTIYNKGRELMF